MNLKYGPYSPSRLETATCPYSFFRQYVDMENRVARREGLPQARGAAVHEIFEHITNQIKDYKNKPVNFPTTEVHRLVTEAVSRHPAAQPETREILDMVITYLNNIPMFLSEDAEIERMMAAGIGPNDYIEYDYYDLNAYVRGRADILSFSEDTTIAYLYDYKTQPNKEEADTFQLGVYAWLVLKLYPYLDEIRTILYFARYGKYSPHVIWVKNHDIRNKILSERSELDPGHVISLTDLEDELMTRIAIVENLPGWDPIPHKGCQYCPVISECPALKELIEIKDDGRMQVRSNFKIMGDTSQAVKVAGYIHILENLTSDLKDQLKEHVKASSPIAIPGKVYCFKTEETVDWDKVNKLGNTIDGIFEKHGIDKGKYQGFSQTLSKSLLYHPNGEFLGELLPVLPMKLTSTFKGWKT